MNKWDKIIIGAGLYGLYSALFCAQNGQKVLLLEQEDEAFKRATYINQARVHNGYHYPRSLSTAIKSSKYFNLFNEKYKDCVLKDFQQIYATSSKFSWTNANEFEKFCKISNIKCEKLNENKYFKDGMCDGAFLTQEYAFDAHILKDIIIKELENYKNQVQIKYSTKVVKINKNEDNYEIVTNNNEKFCSTFVLNATYASINQINMLAGVETFKIKYELCEIILCKVNENLKDIGLTVMDGPFFSIMPFGKIGLHSLTSVTFTPHETSYDIVPTFKCQQKSNGYCSPACLGNCNNCPAKPQSAWPYMSRLARKYMKDDFEFEYVGSLFSMKPILKVSEIDDSRPTVIKVHTTNPTFVSVLSGKINTVFDLEEILK